MCDLARCCCGPVLIFIGRYLNLFAIDKTKVTSISLIGILVHLIHFLQSHDYFIMVESIKFANQHTYIFVLFQKKYINYFPLVSPFFAIKHLTSVL